MSNDYEIFEGKTLSDVFKDIYDNSKTNKQQLEVLMKEVVGFIKDGDTAVQIIPMLKEYLDGVVDADVDFVLEKTMFGIFKVPTYTGDGKKPKKEKFTRQDFKD